MKTTINIPDKKLTTLRELTGEKTKTAAINAALDEYIRKSNVERLIALAGKCEDFGRLEELMAMRNDPEG